MGNTRKVDDEDLFAVLLRIADAVEDNSSTNSLVEAVEESIDNSIVVEAINNLSKEVDKLNKTIRPIGQHYYDMSD